MDYPFGHHQRRDDDDGEQQRYPPPGRPLHGQPPPPSSYYGGGGSEHEYCRPAYPAVQHVSHGVESPGYGEPRPRPSATSYYGGGGGAEGYGEPRPRPPTAGYYGGGGGAEEYGRPGYPLVQHVSHGGGSGYGQPPASGYYGGGGGGGVGVEQYNRPPPSSGAYHAGGQQSWAEEPSKPSKPTVRIFTRAEENYSLTIRDGKVILARNNPSDPYQHWIKDMKYSTRVKDQEGFPSFSLINKVTGEALKHSIGATHPVQLVPYNQDYLDESVLWTESRDTGNGFRCIRMVNNIGLNFDAFNGDKEHGGVRDGTHIVLWEWLKGDNQQWKIVPQ